MAESTSRDRKIRFLIRWRWGDISRFGRDLEAALANARSAKPTRRALSMFGANLSQSSRDAETIKLIVDDLQRLEQLDDQELDREFGTGRYDGKSLDDLDAAAVTAIELFNEENFSEAEFEHWARTSIWTYHEAITLSLGFEPGLMPFYALRELSATKLMERFGRRRDLVLRALAVGDLVEPIRPVVFVNWADASDIEMPDRLRAEVLLIEHRKAARSRAPTEPVLASPETQDATAASPKPELGPRERDTLLKLIVGMAVEQYGYVPGKRSGVAKCIRSDVLEHGLDVSEDTIRDKLRDAVRLLSSDERRRIGNG